VVVINSLPGFEEVDEYPPLVSVKCTNEKNETHNSKTAFLPHFQHLWITCGCFVEL
jgi:hypothetical protein